MHRVLWVAFLFGLAWGQGSTSTPTVATTASTATTRPTVASTATTTRATTTATTTRATTTATTTRPTTTTSTTTTSTTTTTTTPTTTTTTPTTTTTTPTTTTTTPTTTTTTPTTTTTTPTTTFTTTTTTTTTTINPIVYVPLMFYLDFDRVFMGNTAKYLPAFQDAVISMLATQITPPIVASRSNVSIVAGQVGNFSDRTTIANVSLPSAAVAARLVEQLNQIGKLNIFYIGASYYPVPLGYDFSVRPRPESELSQELALNVSMIVISFAGLLAAYLKFHRPFITEHIDEDPGNDSPVPLSPSEPKAIMEDSGFANPSYVPTSVQRGSSSRQAYAPPPAEDDDIPDVAVPADDDMDEFVDAHNGDLGLDDDDDYQYTDDAYLVGRR